MEPLKSVGRASWPVQGQHGPAEPAKKTHVLSVFIDLYRRPNTPFDFDRFQGCNWFWTRGSDNRRQRVSARCEPETSRGIFMRRTRSRRGQSQGVPLRPRLVEVTPSWATSKNWATS